MKRTLRGERLESKLKTYGQRSPLIVCKSEYSRRKSRRIWIPAIFALNAERKNVKGISLAGAKLIRKEAIKKKQS
jgi:hypothetical protein